MQCLASGASQMAAACQWRPTLRTSLLIALVSCAAGLNGFGSLSLEPASAHQAVVADDASVTDLEARVSRTARVAAYLAEDAAVLSQELRGLQDALRSGGVSSETHLQSEVADQLRELGVQAPATFHYQGVQSIQTGLEPSALLAEAASQKLTGVGELQSFVWDTPPPGLSMPGLVPASIAQSINNGPAPAGASPAGAAPAGAAAAGAVPAGSPAPTAAPAGSPAVASAGAGSAAAAPAGAQPASGEKCGGDGQVACTKLMRIISFDYKFNLTVSIVLWVLIFVAILLMFGGCIFCLVSRR